MLISRGEGPTKCGEEGLPRILIAAVSRIVEYLGIAFRK